MHLLQVGSLREPLISNMTVTGQLVTISKLQGNRQREAVKTDRQLDFLVRCEVLLGIMHMVMSKRNGLLT